jgi:hypothetical protein
MMKILKEQSKIEQYVKMTPEQFSSLSKEEVSEILNEVVPAMTTLSKQLEQLEWVFDQLKDQKLLKEVKKFKDKTLRYKNVLVTLISSSYSDPRKILKRLEQENPKLISVIEKIKNEETQTIDKIRKAYSEDRMRPKGYPDKEEKIMTEGVKGLLLKLKDKVKGGWSKIVELVHEMWLGIFDSLELDIDKMTDDLLRTKGKNVKLEEMENKMNLRKIVRSVIREQVNDKSSTNEYDIVRKKANSVINKINSRATSGGSVVRIIEYRSTKKNETQDYQVIFDFGQDKYVDNSKYVSGHAVINLSEQFYNDLEVLTDEVDLKVYYNTKTIFWFGIEKEGE